MNNMRQVVTYWPNGDCKRVEHRDENGLLHREIGPAVEEWYTTTQYHRMGIYEDFHRLASGVPFQTWQENRRRKKVEYWMHGQRHRENGPAVEEWHMGRRKSMQIYYVNGELHRLASEGPAYQAWREDGHREKVEYWLDGQLHRYGNPAVQKWSEDGYIKEVIYYEKGKVHRNDGPAWILFKKYAIVVYQGFYLNDQEVDNQSIIVK